MSTSRFNESIVALDDVIYYQCCQQDLFFKTKTKTKTMLSRPRPRPKTPVARPRPRPRPFSQDQDQDQDFCNKTKTKTFYPKLTRSSRLRYKNAFKLCGLRRKFLFTLVPIKIILLNCFAHN